MIFKLAFRNILRQKRRSILTISSIVAGFAFGSMAIGIQTGSFNQMIDVFTRAYMGHLQVYSEGYLEEPTLYKTLGDYEAIGAKIEELNFVESWAPRLNFAGLASVGEKSDGAGIIGVDPRLEEKTTHLSGKIVEGNSFSDAPNEVILGKGLLEALSAKVGDEIVLVVQAGDGSMGNELYTIVGAMDIGNEVSNRMAIYMKLDEAQELMAMEGRIHEIIIIVDKIRNLEAYHKVLADKIGSEGIFVATWKDVNPNFAQMVDAKKQAFYIIQFVIMLIVAIGVLNTVLMSVLERTREFGVLKALGTKPIAIFRLIVTEASIMCVFGMIGGSVIGTAINLALAHWGIKMPHAYDVGGIMFDSMKAEVSLGTLTNPAVVVFITAFLVSIFPAIKAARTVPAKSLRFH